MGVKSTVTLTRHEAIAKAVTLYTETQRVQIASVFHPMKDSDLEDVLMHMNDEARGGEGFENYTIRD